MNLWVGVLLTVVAAVINGNFALPLKFARRWSWENSWALYSLVAFGLVPWGLALLTNPNLVETYRSLGLSQLLTPLLFGTGWGISQVLLGVSIARVGMALTFAIVIGLSASLGTLIPLVTLHREVLPSARGISILAGIVVMLGGIWLLAKAGREREREKSASISNGGPGNSVRKSGYGAALALTVAAGILTPMLNYALAFGDPVLKRSVELGASSASATFAVWSLALLGGLPVNVFYCVYLLNRNKTWSAFGSRSFDYVWAVLMGFMWMGSIAIYGIATTHLGPSGAAIGWALFSIFIILAANVSGVVAGEWRGVGLPPLRNLGLGLALLIVASGAIAWGNR